MQHKIVIKKFRPASHKVKALVYGPSGAGKTVFAGTAPKILFACAERGLLSIASQEPDYVEINTYNDLQALLDYLKKPGHPYETVVVDSISEINEIIKRGIELRRNALMRLDDWGELANKIRKVLNGFVELPMHVIFIAQEKALQDEDKIAKIVPMLNGSAATEIAYNMDIVAYCGMDKNGRRTILTDADPKLLTKDRTRVLGSPAPLDFTEWIARVAKIQAGTNATVSSHSADVQEDVQQPADAPERSPRSNSRAGAATPPTAPQDERLITEAQGLKLQAVLGEYLTAAGKNLEERGAFCREIVKRLTNGRIDNWQKLTVPEASLVITRIQEETRKAKTASAVPAA